MPKSFDGVEGCSKFAVGCELCKLKPFWLHRRDNNVRHPIALDASRNQLLTMGVVDLGRTHARFL